MTSHELSVQLVKLAAKCFGRQESEIDPELSLEDQGADSLGFADFLFDAEDMFGVELASETAVLGGMKTIRELADYIVQQRAA